MKRDYGPLLIMMAFALMLVSLGTRTSIERTSHMSAGATLVARTQFAQ